MFFVTKKLLCIKLFVKWQSDPILGSIGCSSYQRYSDTQ